MSAKRAIIIHGWGGSPEGNWFPWLAHELEGRGFEVRVPAMPDSETPNHVAWRKTLQELLPDPDESVLLVGHSLGCIAILQYLESLRADQAVGGVILVSGFIRSLHNPVTDGFFADHTDMAKAGQRVVGNIVSIASDNDPYVSWEETEAMRAALPAAKLQTLDMHAAGHINAAAGYTELPEILTFIHA